MNNKISDLVLLLEKQNEELADRERELNDKAEELEAQKEELTAAIEEVVRKNKFLNAALDELQARNQELDQLVYRASHDLKTPITSTLGILNLMQFEALSPNMAEYTHRINLSMQQMNDLLRSITLFTKSALNEVNYQPISIYTLLQQACTALAYVDGYERIYFKLSVGSNLMVQTDPTLLIEVVKAIVSNAITFRSDKSPVITLSAEQKDNLMHIVVEDNGEGIVPEMIDQAFKMFFRGSEKSKGSGLGLYMAQRIMMRLQGNIQLIPQAVGLKVVISLPVDHPSQLGFSAY